MKTRIVPDRRDWGYSTVAVRYWSAPDIKPRGDLFSEYFGPWLTDRPPRKKARIVFHVYRRQFTWDWTAVIRNSLVWPISESCIWVQILAHVIRHVTIFRALETKFWFYPENWKLDSWDSGQCIMELDSPESQRLKGGACHYRDSERWLDLITPFKSRTILKFPSPLYYKAWQNWSKNTTHDVFQKRTPPMQNNREIEMVYISADGCEWRKLRIERGGLTERRVWSVLDGV